MIRGLLGLISTLMPLEAYITSIFSDAAIEYIIYLAIAIASSALLWSSLSKLGTIDWVEANIICPSIAEIFKGANYIHGAISSRLTDVSLSRTYTASPNITFFVSNYLPKTRPYVSRRTRTSVPRRRMYRTKTLCIMLALLHASCAAQVSAYDASVEPGPRNKALEGRFDTDSFVLGLDGHASRCMSPHRAHFSDMREWTGSDVKGIGSARIEGVGTVQWKIEDDRGKIHTLEIKNTLYLPNLHKAILSPQHTAKNCDWTSTTETSLTTKAYESYFKFGPKGEFQRTATHAIDTDVPDIRASASCQSYFAYAAEFEASTDVYELEQYVGMPAVIPQDEDAEGTPETPAFHQLPNQVSISEDEDDPGPSDTTDPAPAPTEKPRRSTDLFAFDDNVADHMCFPCDDAKEVEEIPTNDDVLASSDAGELLRYHYRLGHLAFSQLKWLAKIGLLPKRLANVETPLCASCAFGRMSRRAWKTRAKSKRKIAEAQKPGDVISVDQMESSTVGLIAQLKGRVTTRRYTAATIFVDHFSDLSYVHLQESLSSQDTIAAKRAFEAWAKEQGVDHIKHYHCDNGRFADNAWQQDVRERGQTISFCGVNAHFQNGRAEKRIRDLRESARTSLLHAMSRWPGVVDLHLWAYALRYANDVMSNMPDKHGSSKLQRFSSVPVQCNLKDFHAFGCPVYALDNDLAGGKKIPHWNPRARIGVNLGFSSRHARNVSLVMNQHRHRLPAISCQT